MFQVGFPRSRSWEVDLCPSDLFRKCSQKGVGEGREGKGRRLGKDVISGKSPEPVSSAT